MLFQRLYNPIIEISVIGYVIETLGNGKTPPTITVSLCYYNIYIYIYIYIYKLAEQLTSGLGRFL